MLNIYETSLINLSRVTSIFLPVSVDVHIISLTNSVTTIGLYV